MTDLLTRLAGLKTPEGLFYLQGVRNPFSCLEHTSLFSARIVAEHCRGSCCDNLGWEPSLNLEDWIKSVNILGMSVEFSPQGIRIGIPSGVGTWQGEGKTLFDALVQVVNARGKG